VAQIANTFILRRNIGELLELGAGKIVFFKWDEVHSSPPFKHENEFYRVKKGDLFEAPFRGARTKREIQYGKERNLLVDESANLGPAQGDSAQQKAGLPVPVVP
jgi:hypothetical protein